MGKFETPPNTINNLSLHQWQWTWNPEIQEYTLEHIHCISKLFCDTSYHRVTLFIATFQREKCCGLALLSSLARVNSVADNTSLRPKYYFGTRFLLMLKVIGVWLGRTGTKSLKLTLERLLGKPCYHMAQVFSHPEHIPQ